jgi:predicted ATPase
MSSSKCIPNPDRQQITSLVKTWIKRSRLHIDQVLARMQTHGCDISRATFENYFTRLERNPTILPICVLALIAAFTEGLTDRERAKAGEALELARLTRLPFDQLANLARYFPLDEFQTAYLSYALPQTNPTHPTRAARAFTEPTYTLTTPLTDFIGRAGELSALKQIITDPSSPRLIVLTGAGGCGKTRLALQAAADLRDQFPNGVFAISFAALRDSSMVIPIIAQTLGLQQATGKNLASDLEKYLCERRLLLLLDNLDQVVTASPLLINLLRAAPGLKILATSRIALRLSVEREFPVPPLELPNARRVPPLDQLLSYSAIALFVARARAASPTFELTAQNAHTVIAICARLDGLPLALELAAARVKTMPLDLLLEQLKRASLHILIGGTRDTSPRHQTMRHTIEWSFHRLTQKEKKLFAQLAVFEGGCTAEAILAVIAAEKIEATLHVMDGIASLVAQSMLMRREGVNNTPRFFMLEPLREYARERLADDDRYAMRHATYYRTFAQRASTYFRGDEQKMWLNRVEEENANLRTALEWLIAHGEGNAFMQLAGALELFWYWRGHWSEAQRWLERLLASQISLSTTAYAKANDELGGFLWAQGDLAQAEKYVATSLAFWRESADQTGLAETLNTAGLIAEAQANYHRATEFYREGLLVRRAHEDQPGIALMLNNLAGALIHLGELGEATALCEESFALARKLGHRRLMGAVLFDLGVIAEHQTDFPRAARQFHDALVLFHQFGDQHRVVGCIERLARVAIAQHRPEEAARLFGAAEAMREFISFPISPTHETEHAQIIALAHAQCDADTFARARTEGRGWSIERLLESMA